MSTLLAPLAPGEELIDAESFQRLHAGAEAPGWRPLPIAARGPAGAAGPSRPSDPSSATGRTVQLDFEHCRSRRDVERLTIRRARAHAPAAALFLARRGGIQAVCWDPAPPRTPGPIYWTTRPHALAAVLERLQPWRGAPAHDPLTSRILRSLGRDGVREIALVPIAVRDRLVAFLYVDGGDAPLADPAVAALRAICARVASVWERMIAERTHCESR